MASFERIIYGLSRVLNIFSGIALVSLMCLVFGNVTLRALWQPILGAYEFTSFVFSLSVALALAHCAAKGGHVAITIFADLLPKRVQAVLDAIVAVLGTGLFGVLAWQVSKYAVTIYHSGEVSLTTETPFYPFIGVLALGMLMVALVILNDLFKSLGRIFR